MRCAWPAGHLRSTRILAVADGYGAPPMSLASRFRARCAASSASCAAFSAGHCPSQAAVRCRRRCAHDRGREREARGPPLENHAAAGRVNVGGQIHGHCVAGRRRAAVVRARASGKAQRAASHDLRFYAAGRHDAGQLEDHQDLATAGLQLHRVRRRVREQAKASCHDMHEERPAPDMYSAAGLLLVCLSFARLGSCLGCTHGRAGVHFATAAAPSACANAGTALT